MLSDDRTTITRPGDMTEERLVYVQAQWRHAMEREAFHDVQKAKWKKQKDELGKELLGLEARFPVDWS